MATYFEFDLAGQTQGLVVVSRHFYVLEGGSLLPVRALPAWCEPCRKFTAAERMSPAAEEAKELAEVEYFFERPGLIPPDRRVPIWQLPELRLRSRWRAKRIAPAKCLTCGSTHVTSIGPGLEAEIPGRGHCVARFRGWMDVPELPCEYFSPEGDRVAFNHTLQRSGRASRSP